MFDWKGYLDLANKLIKQDINVLINEACWRSAVSRAYYACFHKARTFAYSQGFQPPPKQKLWKEHKEIPHFLIKQVNSNLKKVGVDLKRLSKNRRDCDYEPLVKNIKSLAESSVMIASKIFQGIP